MHLVYIFAYLTTQFFLQNPSVNYNRQVMKKRYILRTLLSSPIKYVKPEYTLIQNWSEKKFHIAFWKKYSNQLPSNLLTETVNILSSTWPGLIKKWLLPVGTNTIQNLPKCFSVESFICTLDFCNKATVANRCGTKWLFVWRNN